MGSAPSVPAAPDPVATAGAQTGENISTAIANSALSHVNQTNAYGDTSTYSQTGSTPYTDPVSGKTYDIPNYSQTTQLSAPQQQLYDTVQATGQGAANTAQSLIGQASTNLAKPIDLSADNINKFTNTSWEQPFNDTWGQKQDQLNQQLADQGIHLNDPAYQTAQRNFGQELQNAQGLYDTNMYGQAASAIQTQYNQPVNELSALLSSGQVSPTSFGSTPTTNIPTTDYASISNQGYQNQMAQYNAQNAQSSAQMGGLFGLGNSVLGGLMMMA